MSDRLLTREEIQRAFPERIRPIQVTWYYRAWLTAVLVALVLLQALYLALIAASAAATAYYVAAMPYLLGKARLNAVTIVLILAPPVIGAIVTLFLFKPVFARYPKPKEPPGIPREEQPELYAFVEALCASVGAPAPTIISANLEANASAGLRRGIRSLFSNDLRLMIGLPLVSGLTLRQFTGVLAHEFGHFSQSAGLRSWFLIQTIQAWFARVVYERDSWDEWLKETMDGASSWQVRGVLYVAEAAVKGSRWLLRMLLNAGAAVACGFSRQMEFDADHYEAQVAGARTFAETSIAIAAIADVSQFVWGQTSLSWRDRRLASDFPDSVRLHLLELGPAEYQNIRSAVLSEETATFATHPSTSSRIRNVERENAAGIFSLEGPATRLFRDYEQLCRSLTGQHYREQLGEELENAELLSASGWKTTMDHRRDEAAAVASVFGRPVRLASEWIQLAAPPEIPAEGPEDDSTFVRLESVLLDQESGVAFLEARIPINALTFSLSRSSLVTAKPELEQTRQQLAAEVVKLRAGFSLAESRLRELSGPERDAFDEYERLRPLLRQLRIAWHVRRNFAVNERSEGLAAVDDALDAIAAAAPALAEVRDAAAVLAKADAEGERRLGALCVLARNQAGPSAILAPGDPQ